MLKRLISLFTQTGVLVILIALAGVQGAAADEKSDKALVGSWTVMITPVNETLPPVIDLTTVNRDGTMTNSDALFGTGHGVWKHVGDSQFTYKFMTPILVTATPFPPGSMLTVTGTLTVDKDGATAAGPFLAAVTYPPYGSIFDFEGKVAFTRISIDDDDDSDD